MFVLKELNKQEAQLLLRQCHRFLLHFSSALFEGRPCALTPFSGFFKVMCKETKAKNYYIAMHNLRYVHPNTPHKLPKIFDLKGLGPQRYIPEPQTNAADTSSSSSSSSSSGSGSSSSCCNGNGSGAVGVAAGKIRIGAETAPQQPAAATATEPAAAAAAEAEAEAEAARGSDVIVSPLLRETSKRTVFTGETAQRANGICCCSSLVSLSLCLSPCLFFVSPCLYIFFILKLSPRLSVSFCL